MIDIKEVLLQLFQKIFDKKSSCGGVKSNIISNQQLEKELNKSVIRKNEKLKVYSASKGNI